MKPRANRIQTCIWRQRFGNANRVSVLLWLIPWGVLVVLPITLALSALSPAGRKSWQEFGKIRTYAIISMIVVLLVGGFAPTSSPRSLVIGESHCLLKTQMLHYIPQDNNIHG